MKIFVIEYKTGIRKAICGSGENNHFTQEDALKVIDILLCEREYIEDAYFVEVEK